MRVPLNRDAARDAMPAFFDMLTEETDPAVRSHGPVPDEYHDGRGRMSMDGDPLPDQNAYKASLEKAGVGEDIGPVVDFLATLVEKRLAGEPLPQVPKSTKAVSRE